MRPKMSRAQRAKQFIPFTPLEGLEEALRAVEKKMEVSFVAEPTVLDDQAEIINRRLRQIQKGEYVCVEVYSDGLRRDVSGEVVFIDDEMIVVGETEICIKNILSIF